MSRPLPRRIVPTTTYHRTHEEIVAMLTLLRIRCAGKSMPVADALLARLESVGV